MEGGECYFIADYQNATIAVWHFVSPDGQTDLTYDAMPAYFPTLEIINGMYSAMQLKNIPLTLNGWKVYCRYSNDIGSVSTGSALLSVLPNPAAQQASSGGQTDGSQGGATGENPAQATTASFAGTYVDSVGARAQIEITSDAPGHYYVVASWPNSETEEYTWFFSGEFNQYGVLEYKDCSLVVTRFNEAGEGLAIEAFSNGTGKLEYSFTNGGLYWTDDFSGSVADGIYFVKKPAGT